MEAVMPPQIFSEPGCEKLTIRQVADKVRQLENQHTGGDDRYTCGPWDEYFTYGVSLKYEKPDTIDQPWPRHRWVSVYVVTGNSEGLYLHVDLIDRDKREMMFLGKTCRCGAAAWAECYASAGRIAWMLQQ